MWEDMWAKGEVLEGNRHGGVASAPAWNLTVSSSTAEFAKRQEDFEDPPGRAFEPGLQGCLKAPCCEPPQAPLLPASAITGLPDICGETSAL